MASSRSRRILSAHRQKRTNLTRQGYRHDRLHGNRDADSHSRATHHCFHQQPDLFAHLADPAAGQSHVTVQADVMPQPTMPNLSNPLGKALGSLMPHSLSAPTGSAPAANDGPGHVSTAPNVAEAQSLLNTLAPPAGSNLPPLKIGVLSPDNHSSTGLGAVQYVNGALQQVVSQLTQPAAGPARRFEQHGISGGCVGSGQALQVPVSGQERRRIRNQRPAESRYAARGHLQRNRQPDLHMVNTGSGGYSQYPPIPVTISNWSVPDGLHVQTGSINVSPKLALDQSVPALKGTIRDLVRPSWW